MNGPGTLPNQATYFRYPFTTGNREEPCFCCSSGNVTDEVIAPYIETQQPEDDAEFRVEGEAGPTRPPKPSA
jgi:hypothetical protein